MAGFAINGLASECIVWLTAHERFVEGLRLSSDFKILTQGHSTTFILPKLSSKFFMLFRQGDEDWKVQSTELSFEGSDALDEPWPHYAKASEFIRTMGAGRNCRSFIVRADTLPSGAVSAYASRADWNSYLQSVANWEKEARRLQTYFPGNSAFLVAILEGENPRSPILASLVIEDSMLVARPLSQQSLVPHSFYLDGRYFFDSTVSALRPLRYRDAEPPPESVNSTQFSGIYSPGTSVTSVYVHDGRKKYYFLRNPDGVIEIVAVEITESGGESANSKPEFHLENFLRKHGIDRLIPGPHGKALALLERGDLVEVDLDRNRILDFLPSEASLKIADLHPLNDGFYLIKFLDGPNPGQWRIVSFVRDESRLEELAIRLSGNPMHPGMGVSEIRHRNRKGRLINERYSLVAVLPVGESRMRDRLLSAWVLSHCGPALDPREMPTRIPVTYGN